MPLKPIYEKAPLTRPASLPLRAGQAKMEREDGKRLYDLACQAKDAPALWEGAYRLACAVTDKPAREPCAAWIASALSAQREDGALDLAWADAVAVMRAAYAMYEQDAERGLLERMLRWCACLAARWDEAMAQSGIPAHPADLMGLLLDIYRVSGKAAILKLCERLSRQGLDWCGVLKTFSVERPMRRITPWEDMEAGLAAEGGDQAGFYTRQYLTCHAESLADGMRYAAEIAALTGGGRALEAGKTGWEKLTRWHGAVCGGVTGDETLAGTSPASAVDAASLGAWAEALGAQGAMMRDAWAFDALEILAENGLPAALCGDKLIPFERVNGLSANCAVRDCYHVHDGGEQAPRALKRLTRGYAALSQSAVTTRETGADVNLYLTGSYALRLGGSPALLSIAGKDGEYVVRVGLRGEETATLALRIPSWTEDAFIRVNDEGGLEGHAGQWLEISRAWRRGDRITVSFARRAQVKEGHHQGAAVMYGATLMAYPASREDWAVALCGEPQVREGRVYAALRRVPAWRMSGPVPADIPVLPRGEGEPFEAELRPYAETPCRIALFPREGKA